MATLISTGTHPRLVVTSATIPAIRARCADTPAWGIQKPFQAYVDRLDSDGIYTATTVILSGVGQNLGDVWNYAFLYLLGAGSDGHADFSGKITFGHTNAEYRDKAIQLFNSAVAQSAVHQALPLAYDWLYNDLSVGEIAAAKAVLGAYTLAGTATTTNGCVFDDQPVNTRTSYVLAGLAVGLSSGEGTAESQTQLDAYTTLIVGSGTGRFEGADRLSGSDGAFTQTVIYQTHETAAKPTMDNDLTLALAMEAYRTGSTEQDIDTFWGQYDHFRHLPQITAYFLLPTGTAGNYLLGRTWKDDAVQILENRYAPANQVAISHYGSLDADMAALARWLVDISGTDSWIRSQGNDAIYRKYLWWHFIFGGTPTAQSPVELGLPLAKRFAAGGYVVARTLWDNDWFYPTDTWLSVQAATWSRASAYWQPAPANLILERNGPVLIMSGVENHQDYEGSAWCGNTTIFPAVDVSAEPIVNSGWDRGGRRNSFSKLTDLDSPTAGWSVGHQADVTGVQRFENSTAVLYVHADVTRAYNGPSQSGSGDTEKVRRFTRQVVWRRPSSDGGNDRIVVCDRTQTVSTNFEHRQLWHPAAEPTIGGSSAAGPVRWNTTAGKESFTGAGNSSVFWQTAAGTKAWLTPLSPTDRTVVKVGGPNQLGAYGQPQVEYRASFTASGSTATGTTLSTSGAPTPNTFAIGDVVQLNDGGGAVTVPDGDTAWAVCATITSKPDTNSFTFTLPSVPTVTATSQIKVALNPSHEFEDPYGFTAVTSKNGYDATSVTEAERVGQWRVELIPTTASSQQTFITAFEVGSSGASQSTTTLITGSGLIGAQVGNFIALFAPSSACAYTPQITGGVSALTPPFEQRISSGSFTIPSSGTFEVLLCDLDPNNTYSPAGTGVTITDSTGGSGPFTPSSNGLLLLSMAVTNAATAITMSADAPVNMAVAVEGSAIVGVELKQAGGTSGPPPDSTTSNKKFGRRLRWFGA